VTSLEYSGDTSPHPRGDTSPSARAHTDKSLRYRGDVSPAPGGRDCLWCRQSLEVADSRARYCSRKCRQAAFRSRRLSVAKALSDRTMRLGYGDPPYPGLAYRYYRNEPTYAGEVDHVRLLEQLVTYDGWALSTSRKALRYVLSLVPCWIDVRICPWVKTHNRAIANGPSNIHEYVIVKPARLLKPGPPDALVAAVARGGDSQLVGRKPIRFVAWLFELLGAAPSDEFHDLFPGSGIVGRCWEEFCRSGRVEVAR